MRELLAAPGQPNLEIRYRSVSVRFAADLTDALRSLCAIALCELDEPFVAPAGLAHALRDATALELDTLDAQVEALRRDGKLLAVLERVAANCRAAMDVAPELRWPPLAPGAPR